LTATSDVSVVVVHCDGRHSYPCTLVVNGSQNFFFNCDFRLLGKQARNCEGSTEQNMVTGFTISAKEPTRFISTIVYTRLGMHSNSFRFDHFI